MSSGEVLASSSRVSLDQLLEESSAASLAQDTLGHAPDTESEPVPTLASLLLSTAQSLAARSTWSTSAPTSTAKGQLGKQPPSFTLANSPQSLLNNPATPSYLSSLLAQPLTALQSLPSSLSTLSTTLDNDLASLAYTRYNSFLLSYTAAQSISTSFTTLSDSLAALLDSTQALEHAATSFEHRVHAVRSKRERFTRVRERIDEVEELLEAPAVVDACVRAGYWSEAIDVAVRLEELHKRLARRAAGGEGGALVLLDRVRDDVGLALLSLRARVLESLLQRTLKLPGAVRGVSILRRIAERATATTSELDEDGLRLVFLTARWRCLRNELDAVEGQMAACGIQLGGTGAQAPYAETSIEENEERTRWTKRWIEAWREVVGETVGMYTEVFLSSSAAALSSSSTTTPETNDFGIPSQPVDPVAPLHLFLSTALSSLSSVLSFALPSLNSSSSLSSLLTQLTYCSHSFARHGLDFRELLQLRQRVELRLGRIVAAEFELAGRKWEKEWRTAWEQSGGTGTTAAKARRSGRVPIVDWLVQPEGLATLLSTPLPPTTSPSEEWHPQPSPSLALLPPLARFLNAHATALNALRLLPPLAVFLPLRRAQAAELDRATQVLGAFTEAWLAALTATPLLAQNGFATFTPGASGVGAAGGEGEGGTDALSEDEKLLLRERADERRAVAASIAFFGRAVVPWCAAALSRGVYAEVLASGRMGELETTEEESVREARRRCERLVARIEGREYVEEEEEEGAATQNGEEETPASAVKVKENGTSAEIEQRPHPVLDAPAVPLTDPPSIVAVENGLPHPAATAEEEAAEEHADAIPTTAAPVDFSTSVPPVSVAVAPAAADDLPSDSATAAQEEQQAEPDAPYLVPDTAPPPPAAPSEAEAATLLLDAEQIERAGVSVPEVVAEEAVREGEQEQAPSEEQAPAEEKGGEDGDEADEGEWFN
ncbi:hypothetical protein JCM8097_008652 [Rhodosporidiobolus ruineniae]